MRRLLTLALLLAMPAATTACSPRSDATATPTTTQAAATSPTAAATPTPTPAPTPSPKLPVGSEPVELDPADFVAVIDNPYWPMTPGNHWIYRETDAEGTVQQVDVTVTDEKKTILGIEATVVHDVVTEDGELIEDTFDWYAQDSSGNLWYLGEDTKEYEGGELVSTEGSWEGGVDGAQPGILLPAAPEVGMVYRQEYYAGKAEDAAEVLSLDEHVVVPFGTFHECLQTKDYTPLDPNVVEHKFYAKEVGPVMVVAVSGGTSREELISFEKGAE